MEGRVDRLRTVYKPGLTCFSPQPKHLTQLTSTSASRGSASPPAARGLHSSTFQLNVSTLCGTGGVKGVFRGGLGSVCEGMLTGVLGLGCV